MKTVIFWPRRAGKSWLAEALRRASASTQCETITSEDVTAAIQRFNQGTLSGYPERLRMFAVVDECAPAPKQHRIQHGPVSKGRGGKPKRW